MGTPKKWITNFYSLLLEGDIQEITSMFAADPLIDEPARGTIKGIRQFEHFLGNFRQWMQRRSPKVEHYVSTISDNRIIEECVLHLENRGESISLPVAIAADLAESKFTHVRIYHSLWPILNKHMVRPPILPPTDSLTLPPLIAQYMEGLGGGDAEHIVELFAPEGYMREPSGDEFKHTGRAALKQFYRTALAEGGITLHHCTVTFDGERCAVEFIIDKWGSSVLPEQAGIAVYEQDAKERLVAARIYDDVSPPIQ